MASKSLLNGAKSLERPENLIGSGLFSLMGVAEATSLKVEFSEAVLFASVECFYAVIILFSCTMILLTALFSCECMNLTFPSISVTVSPRVSRAE